MIRLLDLSHCEEWDSVVRSFANHDVYYLSGYVKAFRINGDGEPYLMYYTASTLRAIYVYMRRPTDIEGMYDSISPYGYGGVLFEGEVSEENMASFWTEYLDAMCREHIVDGFVRYHPVLRNAVPMSRISEVIHLGKTIAFDLASPEIIWDNIVSKNRNMIRKAEKNGVMIKSGRDWTLFGEFKRIYDATMEKDHADRYYFFDESFYKSIHSDLYENYEMFYAMYQGNIIAMSIILHANNQMHYHLSGSVMEYRHLAPSNLLLYKAALWGCENGYKTFHLGGGVGSGEDNLYKFKAAFNKNSDYRFAIGKQIYNQYAYDELVEIRKKAKPSLDETSQFFPLYRA